MCTAETSVPLPGAMPRATGIVQSMFVAIQGMPAAAASGPPCAFSANDASASSRQPTSGANPCTTAAGASSADRVTRNPRFSSSDTMPSPPTTKTSDPGSTRSSSRRIAACGEVTTSSGTTSSPSSARCRATEASLRDALFVM